MLCRRHACRIPLSRDQQTAREEIRIPQHQLTNHHTAHRLPGCVDALAVNGVKIAEAFQQFNRRVRFPRHLKIVVGALARVLRRKHKARSAPIIGFQRPDRRAGSLQKRSLHVVRAGTQVVNKQHDGVFLSPDNLLRRVKVIVHGLSGFGGEARRQKAVDNARVHVFSRLFFKRFDLFAACHFNWPFLRHMQNGSFDVQPSVHAHLAKARRRVSVIQNQLNKASRSGNHAPRRIRGADRDNRIPFYFKVFRTQLFA